MTCEFSFLILNLLYNRCTNILLDETLSKCEFKYVALLFNAIFTARWHYMQYNQKLFKPFDTGYCSFFLVLIVK